jgi:hypothetical protein
MKESKVIYIAGPMSGLPDYNRFAFRAFEAALRTAFPNAAIINPADNYGGDLNLLFYHLYMRQSIHQLLIADTIYVLSGYENSRGAKIEIAIAEVLELKIVYQKEGAK